MKAMNERTGIVSSKGNSLTLVGYEVNVGDLAPDFQVVDSNLNPVRLSDFKGKVVLLSVTPSLDTGVCDAQARKFNEAASSLSDEVIVLNISMDLPFAIARWCGATGADQIKVLSDYQERDFGYKYGLLIKETKLLARSVWIIDKQGVLRYHEIVPEIPTEPNYEKALEALKSI